MSQLQTDAKPLGLVGQIDPSIHTVTDHNQVGNMHHYAIEIHYDIASGNKTAEDNWFTHYSGSDLGARAHMLEQHGQANVNPVYTTPHQPGTLYIHVGLHDSVDDREEILESVRDHLAQRVDALFYRT